MTASALIIDDEPDIRELIAMTLSRLGLDCHTAGNLEEARNLLDNYAFDVCLTDMKLPDGNGVEFVRDLQHSHPQLPVAVITAHGNMQAAVEAMKYGAFDFVSKPVDITLLRKLVTQAIDRDARGDSANESTHDSLSRMAQRPATLHRQSDNNDAGGHGPDALIGEERLVGTSQPMQALRKMIAKVARTNAPVWITGESGTGKELIARLIHDNSPRAHGPFIAINCGAIPTELMESELFGHKKGSFTGAISDQQGLFAEAEGGTLFLDEVAELPLHMQVKLLRAIQERSIRKVGGTEEIAIDTRILSASHKDLAEAAQRGDFRHDLYYRLNVISLKAPALRERAEDIPQLAEYLLTRLQTTSASAQPSLQPEALQALAHYAFPGNVRELENLLERAVTMADSNVISSDDLLFETQQRDALINDASQTPVQAATVATQGASPADVDDAAALLAVLESTRWNRKQAASKLGLTYRQLRYRMMKLGITR